MENKLKKIAIKGHETRGNEVIEILEMLGGNNRYHVHGTDYKSLYNIREEDNVIIGSYPTNRILQIYSLEEFLEKYPFKVGDKVKYKKFLKHSDFIYIVKKMIWENNQIKYVIYNPCFNEYNFTLTAEDLQLYKEKLYIDCPINNNFNNSKPGLLIDGEKLIAPNGYTIGNATRNSNKLIVEYIKNKPQYPKTYNECCNVLIINPKSNDAQGYKADDIICFQELLIARDAYWELAGDWEEKRKKEINHYVIYSTLNSGLVKDCLLCTMVKHLLDFPTEEMRDAFFENFKDLIEQCKEFL